METSLWDPIAVTDVQRTRERMPTPWGTCIVVIWGERLNDSQPLSDLIEQRPTPRVAHTTCPYRGFPKSSTKPQIAIIRYRHVPSRTYEPHAQPAIHARLILLDMIRTHIAFSLPPPISHARLSVGTDGDV
ncbi:hypothetical protein ARMSODRAFT_775787 [Armillaria solidipes]|uniref:Uncharacterized protein n=1 Tax=Armillaria solidipes TaxID=1076256 RepID=A0A2H3AKZ3_9AGAR|nr:hypothetical protein ARMSODRAFT_775787 [Armillaria solidipes]